MTNVKRFLNLQVTCHLLISPISIDFPFDLEDMLFPIWYSTGDSLSHHFLTLMRLHPRTLKWYWSAFVWKLKFIRWSRCKSSKAHVPSFSRVLSRLPRFRCCCWLLCRVFLLISSVSMRIMLCVSYFIIYLCRSDLRLEKGRKLPPDTTKPNPPTKQRKNGCTSKRLRVVTSYSASCFLVIALFVVFHFFCRMRLCLSGFRKCFQELRPQKTKQ